MRTLVVAIVTLLSLTVAPSAQDGPPGGLIGFLAAQDEAARAQLAAGAFSEAAQIYERAGLTAAKNEAPQLAAVLFMAAGEAATQGDEVQQAVAYLEKGLTSLVHQDLDGEALLERLEASAKAFNAPEVSSASQLAAPDSIADLSARAESAQLYPLLLLKIADAYLRISQPENALTRYDEALARPEIDRAPTLRADVLTNRANALRQLSQLDEADRQIVEAQKLYAEEEDVSRGRAAQSVLGALLLARGDAAGASTAYTRAIALNDAAQDMPGLASAYAGRGQSRLLLGDTNAAIADGEKALEIAAAPSDVETRIIAQLTLGRAYIEKRDFAKAAARLEGALPLIEGRRGRIFTDEGRVAFFDSVADVHDLLIEVLLRTSSTDPSAMARAYEVSTLTQGRALVDLLARERDSASEQCLSGKLAEATPLCEAIEEAFCRVCQTSAATLLEEARREVERRPFGLDQPDPLPEVSFHVLSDLTGVFLKRADGTVVGHVAPVGRGTLRQSIGGLRRALIGDGALRGVRGLSDASGAGASATPEEIGRRLYQTLLAPLDREIGSSDETLAIIPDGPLWLLPFAMLEDGAGRILIERRPIVLATSSQLLRDARSNDGSTRSSRVLLVGDPAFGDAAEDGLAFDPLPGARVEVEAIAALVDDPSRVEIVPRDAATVSAVGARARLAGIVHLAAHGVADDTEPLNSFILLAPEQGNDGRLRARTIVRDFLVQADLVTLSACQSGLGQLTGDGVVGLARAFLGSGARSVLVSLWSVDDLATTRMMIAFYRSYLAGVPKSEALRRAMLEMRSEAGSTEARLWAPFILVGADR